MGGPPDVPQVAAMAGEDGPRRILLDGGEIELPREHGDQVRTRAPPRARAGTSKRAPGSAPVQRRDPVIDRRAGEEGDEEGGEDPAARPPRGPAQIGRPGHGVPSDPKTVSGSGGRGAAMNAAGVLPVAALTITLSSVRASPVDVSSNPPATQAASATVAAAANAGRAHRSRVVRR